MSEPVAGDPPYSKLAVALLVIGAATGLLSIGRITGAEWVSATTWTVAAYMVGQVGAVVAEGWVVRTTAKADP
jgi:hypothetical protein